MENNIETNPMNREILAGKWKQMLGELKTWWGKLTDDDVDTIGGQKDKLTGLLQEKYGYTREKAEQEIERRFQEYGDKTAGILANVSAKAQELGATAAKKANEAAPLVGEKMASLATAMRERGAPRGYARHGYYQSGGGVGIGESLSAREKIPPSGRRLQELGSSLPFAISIGRSWLGLFARRT
jgi:uncharacterized protein YjbJ (UPF0337 family)